MDNFNNFFDLFWFKILDIKIILANKKPTVQTVGLKLQKKSLND